MKNFYMVIQGSFPGGMPHSSVIVYNTSAKNFQIQRKNHFDLSVQRNSNNTFLIDTNRLNLREGGQPLPSEVLQKMDSVFNSDFSKVRIHTGGRQAESIGALAFTMGNDIYFAQGQYNPHRTQGRRTLGHELTHVMQQRSGKVRNPFGSGIAVVNDPGLEAEAERMGRKISNNIFQTKGIDTNNQISSAQNNTIQRVAWLIKDPKDSESENEIISKTFSRWTDPNKITRGNEKIMSQAPYTNTMETNEVIHIEAHGNPTNIAGIGYRKLASAIAKVFGDKLRGRKIIIHACETGSGVVGERETIYYIKKMLGVTPLKHASKGRLKVYAPSRITISDYYGVTRVVKPSKSEKDVRQFLSDLAEIRRVSDRQEEVERFTMDVGEGWKEFVLNNYTVSGPSDASKSFMARELNKIKSSSLIA